MVLAVTVPSATFAQNASSTTELEMVIKTEMLKDSRAKLLPAEQLDAMVKSLAEAAMQQGVTASDITWTPVATGPDSVVKQQPEECNFLCAVNRIFGFGGNDYVIPLTLGVTSAIIIIFISMMLHRHHVHGVEPHIEAIHNLPPTLPLPLPETEAEKPTTARKRTATKSAA